ncbi:ribosome biogenesis factor YjgA [Nitrosomonas sp.]|uniref:ribosome biogenesis factor YjgA n=1 Tax=Nitrosomonas sp. TaxID=42353 RepID=UPI0025DC19B4|nr:ribosome biogenesis factor YjgA [Nitrosomonas sp.]
MTVSDPPQDDTDIDPESRPSKTRLKQEMHALQELGEQLVELEPARITELDLPEKLTDALFAARKITSHGARRRQMQFIGKLMRAIDPVPVQEKLNVWQHSSVQHTAWLHQLERWRDRLISDETAVTEFMRHYPQVDATQLRTLLRNIEKEKLASKPPKSFRALFQLLRQTIPEVPV